MEIASAHDALPITILTGFLGAGKTTLLNRILNGDHGMKIAVLVNDFGKINIDSKLIIDVNDNAISLANGCVCCQIRDDLMDAIDEVMSRSDRPEYIIIEASGVADPSSIALTFVQPRFRDSIRLDSIVAVVDADQFYANPDYPELQELKIRQVAFSDIVILNKTDLADKKQLQQVEDEINKRFNRLRIVKAVECAVPLEILLGVGRFNVSQLDEGEKTKKQKKHINHSEVFDTWSYETGDKMSLEKLKLMVKNYLPANIYRCKGIVYSDEFPNKQIILQVVGRRSDVSIGDDWGDAEQKTQIVAIAESGNIDNNELMKNFNKCII